MARHESAAGKKSKKKGGFGKFLLAVFLVLAVAAAVVFLQVRSEINGSGENTEVTVSIAQGSGTAAIANRLKAAGVIKYPQLFRWYVGRQGAGNKLQYGDFTMPQNASYDEIIVILQKTVAAETVRITFPEGSTAMLIAAKMEEAGLCPAEEFLAEANNGDFSAYRFWQYLPSEAEAPNRFMRCEGYLFPETYDFYVEDTVHNYVATFYAQFDKSITEEMYAKLGEKGMTLPELVTLASIVQEEAGGNGQESNVAQVFINRLNNPAVFPSLQSNTSSYIKNDDDNNYLWNWVAKYYGGWDNIPQNIVAAYDTYSCKGLPAGPISNPGMAALVASLDPQPDDAAKDCYFFVTDLKGTYYYAKTANQHNKNCETAWAVNKTLK